MIGQNTNGTRGTTKTRPWIIILIQTVKDHGPYIPLCHLLPFPIIDFAVLCSIMDYGVPLLGLPKECKISTSFPGGPFIIRDHACSRDETAEFEKSRLVRIISSKSIYTGPGRISTYKFHRVASRLIPSLRLSHCFVVVFNDQKIESLFLSLRSFNQSILLTMNPE